MKFQLMLLATVSVVAVQSASDLDGRYVPDDSGRYVHDPNEGRYIPDNSGQYNPDFAGLYNPDGSGRYADDGSGRYSGQKDTYRGSKFGSGGSGRSGFGSGFGSNNLIGANTFQQPRIVPAASKPRTVALSAGFGSQASAATNQAVRSGSYGSGRYNDEGKWRILRQSGDIDSDGYHWEYLTENGINAEESGKLANRGTDAEAIRAQGFFTYTGPDNVVYRVTYTADENGFVPQGDHLPTPPPVPAAIQRSLDYQRATGQL